jgi:hypothetical protein
MWKKQIQAKKLRFGIEFLLTYLHRTLWTPGRTLLIENLLVIAALSRSTLHCYQQLAHGLVSIISAPSSILSFLFFLACTNVALPFSFFLSQLFGPIRQ